MLRLRGICTILASTSFVAFISSQNTSHQKYIQMAYCHNFICTIYYQFQTVITTVLNYQTKEIAPHVSEPHQHSFQANKMCYHIEDTSLNKREFSEPDLCETFCLLSTIASVLSDSIMSKNKLFASVYSCMHCKNFRTK